MRLAQVIGAARGNGLQTKHSVKSALFWDYMQRRTIVVTGLSRQLIGPIVKGK